MTEQIQQILETMHKYRPGFPRISIEPLSPEWVNHDDEKYEKDSSAPGVYYILADDFEDGIYKTDYDIDYILFSRKSLEQLIASALKASSKESALEIEATRTTHKEEFDDYAGYHSGNPSTRRQIIVTAALKLQDLRAPDFSIEIH